MRLLSRLSFLLAVIIIALYLWAGRSHWFSEWEREVELGSNPLYSATIDIAKKNLVSWTVPKGNWVIDEGEAHVSIVFDTVDGIPYSRYRWDAMLLRVKFDAYAIGEDGVRTNRRIRNWYFKSDEPLSPDTRLWTSGTEHGLGGVWIYPYEQLVLTIEITEPDPVLAQANPRIMIVPEHDYAVFGHIVIVRIFRDGGLVICAILLIAMTMMYWTLSRFAERAS